MKARNVSAFRERGLRVGECLCAEPTANWLFKVHAVFSNPCPRHWQADFSSLRRRNCPIEPARRCVRRSVGDLQPVGVTERKGQESPVSQVRGCLDYVMRFGLGARLQPAVPTGVSGDGGEYQRRLAERAEGVGRQRERGVLAAIDEEVAVGRVSQTGHPKGFLRDGLAQAPGRDVPKLDGVPAG